MTLAGKVALVTGGGRGIGEGIAEALNAAGAAVAIADLDGQRATAVAERVGAEVEAPVLGLSMDVADSASVRDGVAQVTDLLGPVDVLVNNAGVDRIGPFVDSSEDSWDLLLAVNLKGPILCARAVLDGMLERRRGRIINIGSDAGRVGSSGEVVYSATKGGIIAFTKALAREVAAAGITVNCVCPGPTDTALLGQLAEVSQKLYDSLARSIPLKRIGQPSDIAPAVAFLASDDAAYITGQTLSVSGGLTMS
jgi:2-hydroxycyclohexanecarboxyl-CoA dehydrogenase